MASQGPLYPLTAAGEAVSPENAEAWNSVNFIKADDGSTCNITASTFDTNDISNRLKGTNFGFTIPAGATIDGIVVEIEKSDNNIGSAVDNRVQLLDAAGALVGSNKADTATNWPNSLTITTYGGTTDKWAASPTPTMVNDVDFGVVMSGKATSNNTDIFVDFIRMTVYYTESGPVEADGSSAGVGTSSIVGAALFLGNAASTGIGTPSYAGVSVLPGVTASAGVGSSSVEAVSVLPSGGASSGVAADAFIGVMPWAASYSSTGLSDDQGISSATAGSEGASAGVSVPSGVASATHEGAGSAAGVASQSVISANLIPTLADSSGVATQSIVGAAPFAGVGSIAGTSEDLAVSSATAGSEAGSVGVAADAVAGSSIALAATASTGQAASTVLGSWLYLADGSVISTSSVLSGGVSVTPGDGGSAGVGSNAFVSSSVLAALLSSAGLSSVLGDGDTGGGFPPQYGFFLSVVSENNAPAGMGGVLKVRKNGVTYGVYLVETNDPNASPVRIKTTTGIKSIRLKT